VRNTTVDWSVGYGLCQQKNRSSFKGDGTFTAIKKGEIILFTEKWMELETIILSEISQAQKDIYHMLSLICGI
jgi:hypothetical protein